MVYKTLVAYEWKIIEERILCAGFAVSNAKNIYLFFIFPARVEYSFIKPSFRKITNPKCRADGIVILIPAPESS